MTRSDLPAGTRQLRGGDLVEVRSEAEILATLDPNGALGGLPFMPEMLASCGKQFIVESRADTSCFFGSLLDMEATVHLKAVRCDGSAHGGCQVNCLIFWREEWLRPVAASTSDEPPPAAPQPVRREGAVRSDLERATHQPGSPLSGPDERWSCQNTQLREAGKRIQHWDLRHFVRDVRNGTVRASTVLRYLVPYLIDAYQAISRHKLPPWLRINGGAAIPAVHGSLTKTPTERTNLQPGERVRVRTRREIRRTVNRDGRNRGLSFDVEMTPYCGRSMEVKRRVDRVIDDFTGQMVNLSSDCIVLEGAVCKGLYHGLCTRQSEPYWREIWLERESQPGAVSTTEGKHEAS